MSYQKKIDLKIGLIVLIVVFNTADIRAQTCCSGGVPLSGNIGGLKQGEKGDLQLSLNFDGNFLKTLKDGNETLDDRSRQRTTYSALLRANYSVSNKFALEILLTAIRQEREINQGNFQDFTSTNGVGDIVVMGYFNYLKSSTTNLTFGAGSKLPIGPSDLKDERNITLNADLQPGSGAWDFILHHRFSKSFSSWPSATFSHIINYRVTGTNNDYFGSQQYRFGNELQMITGITDQRALGSALVNFGLNLKYRHAAKDINNNTFLPNTGGEWVFIMPTASWYIMPDLAITSNVELPLYSEVDGTQLTPSFRINIGVYWTLRREKKFIESNSIIK